MMISTRGRYALKIMLDLAKQAEEEFVSLKEICERQGISVKYLESIMPALYKSGLIESRRGKTGGYRLAKKPEDCSAFEIIRNVEIDFYPVSCLSEGASGCEKASECLTLPMWVKLDEIVEGYLKGITLKDLLEGNV
ncbi:MAG: RrF2 family transcriptional regulator [Bacillota bacterium]|nr:RrF2 family transcriptional regulator [Bacillota bacterium]